MRVWDISLGQCIKTIFHDKTPPISAVKFSPNNKFILSTSLNNELRLWDYESNKCLKLYDSHINTKYCCFSSFVTTGTNKSVITGTDNGICAVYDLQSRKLNQSIIHQSQHIKLDEESKSNEHINNNKTKTTPVIAIATHPTENIILTGGTEPNHSINVWSYNTINNNTMDQT